MSRLRKIEKGNDGNVPLIGFFFFFFQIFLLVPKKKKKNENSVVLVGLTAAVTEL